MTAFEEIKELALKYGGYSSIPPKTMSRKAQVWCARMRHYHSVDNLRSVERDRIESIPGWTWEPVYQKRLGQIRYVRVPGTKKWVKEFCTSETKPT